MKKLTSLIRQYPLAAFFILALALGPLTNLISDAIYTGSLLSTLVALPIFLLGIPVASALFVSAVIGGRRELFALLRKLTIWRVGWHWYLVALLLLPGLHLLAIYLNVLLGAPAPAIAAFGPISGILGTFLIRVVSPIHPPLFEEPAWRGFAQPRFQQRYSPLTANLILGVLVTLWHLQFIPGGGYEWIFIPGTMAVTILFGWVYNATGGSVLLTLIMHAVEPVLAVRFTGADEMRFMALLVLVYVVTATIVVLLTGKSLGLKQTAVIAVEPQPAATAI